MLIEEAQRDVRTTFLGGFMGSLVSSLLWLLSAALGTWGSTKLAIIALVIGGMFIFPITLLGLRLMGRSGKLLPGSPMSALAMQIAFTIPLTIPVIGAATLYKLNWFYPAFLIVVGAHYLPFTFLYGMRMFLVLGAVMIGAGLVLGLYVQNSFTAGGWVGAGILFVFALAGRALGQREAEAT